MTFFVFSGKIFILIFSFIGTAFFTLYERKIMGLGHYRVGPNKISMMGLLQPFSDVVKLMSKNENFSKISNIIIFSVSPLLMLVAVMVIWVSSYYWGIHNTSPFAMMQILMVMSISIFFILAMGWVGGSFYTMLGSYRSTAQMISYESIMFLMFFMLFWTCSSFSFKKLFFFSASSILSLGMVSFFFLWVVAVLAEANRTPFDFSEGESELVSGFNTEYSSGMFSIIFLSEYMMLLFFGFLTSFVVVGKSSFFQIMFVFLFLTILISLRCSYPRFRYDFLMLWSWKILMFMVMPLVLFFFMLSEF